MTDARTKLIEEIVDDWFERVFGCWGRGCNVTMTWSDYLELLDDLRAVVEAGGEP